MNIQRPHRPEQHRGFTLIELLTVIAIIGILAAMITPAIAKAKEKAKIALARQNMQVIIGAINSYSTTYGRLPASKQAQNAITETTPDFTFGTAPLADGTALVNLRGQNLLTLLNPGLAYQANNSEVVAILRNLQSFRNGQLPVNWNPAKSNPTYSLNPQNHDFLDGMKDVDYVKPPIGKASGIGPDGIIRDPWGNPYIITLDLNYDNRCRDAVYSLEAVSRDTTPGRPADMGYNGLRRFPVTAGSTDTGVNRFESGTTVMVWSFGPDGAFNAAAGANAQQNKDNILSWK
jgi:prepilin-type N-terminal cleavage/methylation domain-containing protein